MAKDKGKDKGKDDDGEGSNLVPAIIIAVGFILMGKFAGAGGAAAPAVAGTATTVEASAHEGSGEEAGATTEKSTAGEKDAESTENPTTTATTVPHWEYEGEHGPVHWAELTDDYVECADGSKQSPIDVKDPIVASLTDVKFDYVSLAGTDIDNGHAIQVKFGAGSSIAVDGVKYELQQMHFHTPSEHTFDGKSYVGELHLVHADAEGNLAVVGLLIEEGDENARLQPLFKAMPAKAEADAPTETPSAGPFELGLLLPEDRSTIRYEGSLTTPPCSETVQWLVVKKPITLSADQLSTLEEHHEDNIRPPQKLNGRTVLSDKGPDA